MKSKPTFDIYATITDRIIKALESGVIPWEKPWKGGSNLAVSHATGKPYSLLNQLILDRPGEYITWNQIQEKGGHVKKGAKSSMVVFWKMLPCEVTGADGKTILNDDGTPAMKVIPYLRYFNVFHIDDCEGIAAKHTVETPVNDIFPIDAAENVLNDYVTRSGVRLENVSQNRAYYSPSADIISLPLMTQFADASEYYSTAFHEATHSTGHVTRLNRFEPGAKSAAFGSETYSKEELVAEIGAASVLNYLGIETDRSFRNSAAYIQSWLKVLKNDTRMIVSAASRAEKAVKLILNQAD